MSFDSAWLAEEIHELVHAVRDLVKALHGHHRPRELNATLAVVYGRRQSMPVTIPVPKLLDTEKIMLSVMPRRADGHVDSDAVVSWSTSDASQIGLLIGADAFVFHDDQFNEDVTCPGTFNAFALTPLDTGTGSVTASAPGYDSAVFGPINYAPGVPRSLNASIGSPVSDL